MPKNNALILLCVYGVMQVMASAITALPDVLASWYLLMALLVALAFFFKGRTIKMAAEACCLFALAQFYFDSKKAREIASLKHEESNQTP